MTDINDEFELGIDGEIVQAEAPTAPKPRRAKAAKPPKDAPKAGRRYTIVIDEVEGAENYEVVGVNGVTHQLMRGVPIEVGEDVVEVLRNAIATRWVKVQREDGRTDLVPRNYSTIPWRMVG